MLRTREMAVLEHSASVQLFKMKYKGKFPICYTSFRITGGRIAFSLLHQSKFKCNREAHPDCLGEI